MSSIMISNVSENIYHNLFYIMLSNYNNTLHNKIVVDTYDSRV